MGKSFINADDTSTITATLDDVTDKHLFAYCDNNPVVRYDPTGYIWETILDVGGIIWSAVDLITKPSWANAGYLAWDIGATLLPFVPGSYTAKAVKITVKVASKADDVAKATKKAVVIGEGMDRVKDATKALQRSGVDAKWYQAWGKNLRFKGQILLIWQKVGMHDGSTAKLKKVMIFTILVLTQDVLQEVRFIN